ncbi:MAG: ATP-binding protein [Pseudomonadota bacterium]
MKSAALSVSEPPPLLHRATLAAVLACCAVVAAWTGDQLALQYDGHMLLWPIGAVSLLAMWLLPWRVAIPVMLIGPLVNGWLMDHTMPMLASRMLGACATGMVGVSLLRAFGVRELFGSVSDVLRFLALAVIVAPAISGALAIGLMWQLDGRPAMAWSLFWWVCWATEAIAILTLVPLAKGLARPFAWPGRYELISLVVVTVQSAIIFDDLLPERFAMQLPLAFVAYPILLWAAFKVSMRWLALLLVVHAGFALWATAAGMGPFTRGSTVENLLLLHGNLGLLSCTTLLLSSALAERRDAIMRLSESENRYRLIVENQSECVCKLDADGNTVFATPNTHRWLPQLDGGDGGALEWLCQQAGEPAAKVWRNLRAGTRVELQSENGGVWVQWQLSPILEGGLLVSVIVVGNDISAQRVAQEEARQHLDDLTHLGRLSDMAQMAGGLAHELNQPLTAVITFAQASQRLLKDNPDALEARGAISRTVHNAQRAAEIIQHMREFVRKSPAERENQPLDQLVREVFSLLAFESRKQRVALMLDAPKDRIFVDVSRVQIHQVLVNLLRNAMQAMVGAGTYEPRITVRLRREHGSAWMDVRDNGPGLPSGAQNAVFEPFRSESPNGLGLGLSISRAIVEAHDGDLNFVDVASGCCARVRLPIAELRDQRRIASRGVAEAGDSII